MTKNKKVGSSGIHRNYPIHQTPKFNVPIEPRRSYSYPEEPKAPPWMKPVLDTNQEYIDAGAADDKDTPLCWGIPQGKPCLNVVIPGTDFCQDCDES